jgi:alanine racemase
MTRPLSATIDIGAMRHNFSVVRQCVPNAKAWAVVKADAYGHGLANAVKAFSDADGLALIEIDKAIALRENGYNKPILLLEGFFKAEELPDLAAHDISFAVANDHQMAALENANLKTPVNVHLKMNSGMNRLGYQPHEYKKAYARLKAIPWVKSVAFMTHFANSETPNHPKVPVTEQLRRFNGATEGLTGIRNLSNSAAILLHPDIKTDWVRPGIMLYGGTPGGKSAEAFGLKPAMSFDSEIIQIQHIKKGESVGYGSLFTASENMTIGVVACGYADGYPRVAPEGTPIAVNGIKTRLVGRVSMDMLTVDLTGIPGAHIGSKVNLWGNDIPIEEVANAAGTVGYELMCAVNSRPTHLVKE